MAPKDRILDLRRRRGWRIDARRWREDGAPLPPPHAVKARAVWSYGRAASLRVLVETGTYHGAMIDAVRTGFDRIVSIELDGGLYRAAADRFADDDKVTILNGDSAEVLPGVVAELSEPAIFWLDGHYSGEGTALSENPILAELRCVLGASARHVVLVDDAVDFETADGSPPINALREVVEELRPQHRFEVKENIIRIHAESAFSQPS